MAASRTIRVFIASPGDLAVERRAFKEVIEALNDGFGDGADVRYEALGWEDTLASTGRRSQSVINQDVDRCDVFVLALYGRWGQAAPDAQPYTSYTEEEFHRAMDRWKQTGAPEIFVFFKHVTPREMADPGKQLEKVLAFRKSLEDSRKVLYHFFADEPEFRHEVNRHLRAYANGELPQPDAPREAVLLPLEYIAEVTKAKDEAKQHKDRAEQFALEFAERAAKAALEGRVEEARQDFAKATDGTTNLRVLYLAFEFYFRTGALATAEELLERWLAISGRDAETAATAAALGNLGLIYRRRGELDRAEEMHLKSLAIEEMFGNEEGVAGHTGNLGVIYQARFEQNRDSPRVGSPMFFNEVHSPAALHLFDLSDHFVNGLDIVKEFHPLENTANQYDLPLIYEPRGELDRAEELHQNALATYEKNGHQEGIASQCGNLGLIYRRCRDLDRAEEMHKKSLAFHEKLGNQEGMAGNYANLGLVAKDRGEFDRARELWTRARDLYTKIGIPHQLKKVQGWIDGLEQAGSRE